MLVLVLNDAETNRRYSPVITARQSEHQKNKNCPCNEEVFEPRDHCCNYIMLVQNSVRIVSKDESPLRIRIHSRKGSHFKRGLGLRRLGNRRVRSYDSCAYEVLFPCHVPSLGSPEPYLLRCTDRSTMGAKKQEPIVSMCNVAPSL